MRLRLYKNGRMFTEGNWIPHSQSYSIVVVSSNAACADIQSSVKVDASSIPVPVNIFMSQVINVNCNVISKSPLFIMDGVV